MRVLVGCETSGKVREAFRRRGHTVLSVDLLPADDDSPHHVQRDIRTMLWDAAIGAAAGHFWDLAIFHPPCTRLCNSGVRWLHERDLWAEMREACELFLACLNAPIPRVAVENPVMHKYAREIIGRGPDFTIQPWQFGHGEVKRTCFWTRGLPPLVPTNIVEGREARIHKMTPGPDRWKKRSETYQGIADAMAEQWGSLDKESLAA
jgi:hypothetical protein